MKNEIKIIYGLYSKTLKTYLCYYEYEHDCKEYMKNYIKNGVYDNEKRGVFINGELILVIHDIVLL